MRTFGPLDRIVTSGRLLMPRCFSAINQQQTAAKRIALCCGCGVLTFVTMRWFGLLPRIQASGNILPNHQVHAAPTETQPELVASYGKLPISFEANVGQSASQVQYLALK